MAVCFAYPRIVRAGRVARGWNVDPPGPLKTLTGRNRGVGTLPGDVARRIKSCLGRLALAGRNGEDAVCPEHVPQVTPKSELTAIAPPKPSSKSVPIPTRSSQRQRWLREGSVVAASPRSASCSVSRGPCSSVWGRAAEAGEGCVARLEVLLEVLLAEGCNASLLLLHLSLLRHNLFRLEALEFLELRLDGRSLRSQLLLLLE